MTPAEFMQGKAEGYRIVDAALMPSISGAPYVDLNTVTGEVKGLGKEEKLLLICNKGKRAYLLQNRLRFFGYTNTKVLEGRPGSQCYAKTERTGYRKCRGHQESKSMGLPAQ